MEKKNISVADEWRANPLSKLFFSWLTPLVLLGARRPLQRGDLGIVPTYDKVEQYAEAFEKAFSVKRSTRASLRAVLWSHMLRGFVCKGLGDAAAYVQIWAVRVIIAYSELREVGAAAESEPIGWPARSLSSFFTNDAARGRALGEPRVVDLAVMLLVLGPCIMGVGLHWFYHYVMIDGLHARSALKSVLFRKLLRIPAVSGGNADAGIQASVDSHLTGGLANRTAEGGGGSGKILNLQNGDTRAIEGVYHMCAYWIFVPIQIGVFLFILSSEVGVATLVGLGVMLVAIPFQMQFSKLMKARQAKFLAASDRRMRGVKETVQSIQAVKVFGWEPAFFERVRTARAEELGHGASVQTLNALSQAFMECVPIGCALATLSVPKQEPSPQAPQANGAVDPLTVDRFRLLVLAAKGRVSESRLGRRTASSTRTSHSPPPAPSSLSSCSTSCECR